MSFGQGFLPDVLATPFLIVVLVALARYDLRHNRLPDRGTLALVAAGLALAFWRSQGLLPWLEISGACAGFAVFWAIGELFWRVRGQDGLGLGDAKLMAACGAWVGIEMLPLVVLISAGSALIFVVATRHDRAAPLAFGPWLAVGFLIGWCVHLVVV